MHRNGSATGGHMESSPGMLDWTVYFHYVINTTHDRLSWHVSHLIYPHNTFKRLRSHILTIVRLGGLSGFIKRTGQKFYWFGLGL